EKTAREQSEAAQRDTEAEAEKQNAAARDAQRQTFEDEPGVNDSADDDVLKQAAEQNEAARNAQAQAREVSVFGGFGGEVPELPRGTKRPAVGDEVYYALDHDGIAEWLPATVTDSEPWQGGG